MFLSDLKTQLREPCRRHSVRRLQVFGSVSRGLETPESDVDFLVQFQDMPPGEYARQYFALLHGLEDTLGRPVDLITAGSVKRESLKRSIQKEAIVLYEA
jgi:hypothetical protein